MLKYVNHLGETIEFDGKNFFTNSYVMRDYAWNYDNDFNKIKNFNVAGINSKTLAVSMYTSSQAAAFEIFNSVFEIFEKDVFSHTPGKFRLGNYYYNCYISSSTKKEFVSAKNLLNLEFTVLSDTNTWVREESHSFSKNQQISGHGYVYGYPYRYASGLVKTFSNDALISSNFKLIIYGPASDPALYIGNHLYSVETEVEPGEYLEIDSRKKIVDLVQADGTRISKINFRNRDSYIFQKIPAGSVSASWNNSFGFDLIIYDERSEPKWT